MNSLGEYTKNDPFQHLRSVRNILTGLAFAMFFIGLFMPAFLPVGSIIFIPCIVFVMPLAWTFYIVASFLAYKIDGIGNTPKFVNLKELEKNLITRINECKTKETVKEEDEEQTKTYQLKEGQEKSHVKEKSATNVPRIYPSLSGFFSKDSISTNQNTVSNSQNDSRGVPSVTSEYKVK